MIAVAGRRRRSREWACGNGPAVRGFIRVMPGHDDHLILLTGATGYVGGRLLDALEADGRRVRCLSRRPASLEAHASAGTELVAGDVLEPATLPPAMEGAHTAYYLIHSMGATGAFAEKDRRAAENFGEAARAAGVKRIVYLGGLGHGDELSPHLESRQEVGRVLRGSGVPTLELRASIILGSGSASFEIVRSLVEKLPVMVTPRWVDTEAQPIGIEDVVAYLVEAADVPLDAGEVVEIGGPDRVSYGGIMREYARQRGLRRLMVRVPFLTPRLSSLWLGLVTPVYARIGRELIDGVRNPTVVRDDAARRRFTVQPCPVSEAIARALENEDAAYARTRWSDALSSAGETREYGGEKLGARIVDSRTVRVAVPRETAFVPIRRMGGEMGWYYGDRLWRIRGFLDLLLGGVGVRRGRRAPDTLAVGDALDFWRVEDVEDDRLLRLRAEMKVPGRAWLQFEVEDDGDGSRIRQTAIFDPLGLAGLAYWYILYPAHALVFRGMLRRIADAARRLPA